MNFWVVLRKIKNSSASYHLLIIAFAIVFYFSFIHERMYGEFDLFLNVASIVHENFAKNGIFHFWTPLISGGFPLYASPQVSMLEFTNLVYALIPNAVIAFNLGLLVYLIIGGTVAFLLSFELVHDKRAALIGAVVYMFTGNMLLSLSIPPFFY